MFHSVLRARRSTRDGGGATARATHCVPEGATYTAAGNSTQLIEYYYCLREPLPDFSEDNLLDDDLCVVDLRPEDLREDDWRDEDDVAFA